MKKSTMQKGFGQRKQRGREKDDNETRKKTHKGKAEKNKDEIKRGRKGRVFNKRGETDWGQRV